MNDNFILQFVKRHQLHWSISWLITNYKERKKNLHIVLSCERVIDTKCPSVNQLEVRTRWKESNDIICCYIMVSVTSTLQKLLESYKTIREVMDKLEEMFGSQVALAQ